MCINKTYSVLNGDVVANEYYSIRYVMDNDSPRFVLCDFFKSLGYATPYQSAYLFCKKLNLGKVVTKRNQLVTYVTKEEAEIVMQHMYLKTTEFEDFWKNEVIPATDYKYAKLKERNSKLMEMCGNLEKKIMELVKERETVMKILNGNA